VEAGRVEAGRVEAGRVVSGGVSAGGGANWGDPPPPSPSRGAWSRPARGSGLQLPKRRPVVVEALEEATTLLADARHFTAKFLRLREAYLREVLRVVRPRVRASAAEHRACEAREVAVGLSGRVASAEPYDAGDAQLCGEFAGVFEREAAAERRAAAAFLAVVGAFGQREAERAVRRAPTSIERKMSFHHGDLREAAIRVAVIRMRTGGPLAVTMRGVARELGVTDRALSFHFRNVEGFRSAVAAALLEQLAVYTHTSKRTHRPNHPALFVPVENRLQPRKGRGGPWAEELAEGWLDYAVENPALYKQIAGEGWHRPKLAEGVHPGGVVSPRAHLRSRAAERLRGKMGAERAEALADDLSITLHGLALARIDGASEAAVRSAVLRLVAAAPG
jgi:AcrR family transcriptional regulator